MARKFICGFETGDFSEGAGSTSGTNSVQSAIVRTGNYAAKFNAGATSNYRESKNGFNLVTCYSRVYFYIAAAPSNRNNVLGHLDSTDNDIHSSTLTLNTSGKLELIEAVGTVTTLATGPTTINFGQWNLIETRISISATVGTFLARLNGNIEINASGLNTGTVNVDRIYFGPAGAVTVGQDTYYDDIAVDDAALPGAGQVICRQVKAGTPNQDGWTKTGGSGTIDSVWADTPFNATKFAVTPSATTAIAQTGLTASFSATQSGHGTEIIQPGDAIKGIQVVGIAKCSATSSNGNLGSVRYRAAAVDNDTNVTITASDAGYSSNVMVDTLANLNASEIGWNRRAATVARTQTVEDMFCMVEYLPSAILKPRLKPYLRR